MSNVGVRGLQNKAAQQEVERLNKVNCVFRSYVNWCKLSFSFIWWKMKHKVPSLAATHYFTEWTEFYEMLQTDTIRPQKAILLVLPSHTVISW